MVKKLDWIGETFSINPIMKRILTTGIEKLSDPLELVISAMVAPNAVKNEKQIKYVAGNWKSNLPNKAIKMKDIIKYAMVPCIVFLSFHITNSKLLDEFSPMIAAKGSAIASIAKLMTISSVYCQNPIVRIKYPNGKYIVP